MSVNHKTTPIRLAILCCSLLLSSPASAQFFINLGGANVSIDDGNMDGVSSIGDSASGISILPRHDDAVGLNIGIGAYWDKGSFSLSVVNSEHDGQWQGIKTSSDFQSIAFDFKQVVLGENDLQAQAIFGVGTTSLNVFNGATSGGAISNAKYKGFDFRLGAGVRYRVSDSMSLEFNVIRRIGSYETVDSISPGSDISGIDGDGFTTSVDLIYIFGQ